MLKYSTSNIQLKVLYINSLNNIDIKFEILEEVNTNKIVICSNKRENLNDILKIVKVNNKYLFYRNQIRIRKESK